jgi:hypothetical protein
VHICRALSSVVCVIGEADVMDVVLDRYMNLVAEPFKFYQNWRSHSLQWNSESHLAGVLRDYANTSLVPHDDFWALKIRGSNYQRPLPPSNVTEFPSMWKPI